MTHRVISLTLLLLCAAVSAYGGDLEISIDGAAEYDDNVFRRQSDEEDDVLFRIRPGVRLFEDRGEDLNFSLGYEIPFEFAVENNEELRDEDHIGEGHFAYHVSDRVQVFGRDRYGYMRSTLRRRSVGSDGVTAPDAPTIDEGRDRVTRNDASLGMTYMFAPRMVGRVVASSEFFDSTNENRSRNYSVGADADLQYTLTLKHQVGGGVGYGFQEFDDRDGFAGSEVNTYNLFGSWRWTIDETLVFDGRAGPSYLTQEQNSAPAVRTRPAVPFTVLPGGNVNGFDINGNAVTEPVGAGSLLVPSFLAATGTGTNCAAVEGRFVASGCRPNIVLDSADPTDQQIIGAILNSSVPLTHINPAGDSGSNLTFFAQATLSKRWTPTLATGLRYLRHQGNASGLGGSVIVDAVSLSNTWDFWERWQLALRGDWTRRESVFDSEQTFDQVIAINDTDLGLPGGIFPLGLFAGVCDPVLRCAAGTSFNASTRSRIDTQRWGVAGRITHRLFRTTLLYVQVSYDDQESQTGSLGRTTDFENLLATFGVRHVFEPIKLW